MSISSHLSPEPERRLWIIHENQRNALEVAEWKAAAIVLACALEGVAVKVVAADEPLMSITIFVLAVALLTAGRAFIPAQGVQPRKDEKPNAEDALVLCEDIAKYTHGELILRLDRYLGGGITATPYYEDIVGQIMNFARTATRKRRMVRMAAQVAYVGQLLFLVALLRG